MMQLTLHALSERMQSQLSVTGFFKIGMLMHMGAVTGTAVPWCTSSSALCCRENNGDLRNSRVHHAFRGNAANSLYTW